MHQQSSVSAPPINIYRPVPDRVLSPTLHILSPLSPPSPNHKNLRCRRRRSEKQATQHRCQLRPPRQVCHPRGLPPRESPTSVSLLSAYTPSSLSISPSRNGQPKDKGSKHHHLVIRDPRHHGIQSGEDVTDSPRQYRQPLSLVSNAWSCASFNS
jgi:hypothetical protein